MKSTILLNIIKKTVLIGIIFHINVFAVLSASLPRIQLLLLQVALKERAIGNQSRLPGNWETSRVKSQKESHKC